MSFETLPWAILEQTSDAIVVGRGSAQGSDLNIMFTNPAFTELFGTTTDAYPEPLTGMDAAGTWQHAMFQAALAKDRNEARTIALDVAQGRGVRLSLSLTRISCGTDGGFYICAAFRRLAEPATDTAPGRQERAKPLISGPNPSRRDQPEPDAQMRPAMDASPSDPALETRLATALDAYPDPIVVYGQDLGLIYWNSAYAASVSDGPDPLQQGMHLEEVLRMMVRNGRYPDAVGREDAWVQGILSSQTLDSPIQDVELDGDTHHRLTRSRSAEGDYVVIRLDATELVRQKRAAEEAQARLIAALNGYPSPFVIYDSNDCLVVWNEAYRHSMANHPDDLQPGMHRTDVTRVAIRAGKIADAIGREEEWMSDAHQATAVAKPVQDLELAGDIHHRLLRSRAPNGDLVIIRLDTTELVRQRRALEQYSEQLEKANFEITHQAFHDDLTGLGNRRHLSHKFAVFVRMRARHGGEIAALHIDLDRFKQINDTMGHAAGDKVLLDTSRRIMACVEKGDVVARIGGDEFIVLVYLSEDDDRPERLARQLLEELSQPTLFEGKECRFGASIGMARTPLSSEAELLTNSDVALYKAKRDGRGQLGIFDQSDLRDLRHYKNVADDILRGIEQNEFLPFYQPQIDAQSGEIVGMEALARWDHPEKGILPPGVFLSVATDLSVAAEIDKMIFERAIKECSNAFRGLDNPPALSFNVSAKRVNDAEFKSIRAHVQAYPGRVAFELLETIFLEEEDDEFLFQLDQLRDLGVDIEVDDFGSGRASVVALQRIAPDRLKIDRRLVAPITESASGLRLLRSIVDIGHALNMGVTAEGVETQAQFDLLRELGCDRMQGYHIARPLPFDALLSYLQNSGDYPLPLPLHRNGS